MFCKVHKKEIITKDTPINVYDISVEKYHNFILSTGAVVHNCDTFQSAATAQDLKSDGYNVEILSVDRVAKDSNGKPLCLPYHYLKQAIYERRIKIYQKCDLLTDELIGLERKSDGHLDHTKQGIDSKDQADAVCGSIYLASKYAAEYSYNYGDSLEAAFDANSQLSDEAQKAKFIEDFQTELAQLYFDNQRCEKIQSQQEQEEYYRYMDISDGIIVI